MGASIIPTIISTVGSAVGGYSQAKQNAKDKAAQLAEEQRQFNANLANNQSQYAGNYAQKQYDQNTNATTSYGDRAAAMNRELQVLPAKDKAMALLMQRMGAPAQQTSLPNMTTGGTNALRAPVQMPYDLNAAAQQAAAYKPGDGGMTGDIQKQLLARYMNVPSAPNMPTQTPTPDTPAVAQLKTIIADMQAKGVPDQVIAHTQKLLANELAKAQTATPAPARIG